MDWAQPWWQDYRALGQPIARRILSGEAVWQALNAHPAQMERTARTAHADWSVSFVPQADLPPEQAYEAHIFQTHRVPTRCGAHDFFNGLIWQHWPKTKRVLNALQWAQIEKDGVQKTRGPLRDALTLLDENGALLIAPQAIWDALVTRDWVTALHTPFSMGVCPALHRGPCVAGAALIVPPQESDCPLVVTHPCVSGHGERHPAYGGHAHGAGCRLGAGFGIRWGARAQAIHPLARDGHTGLGR